MKRILETLRWKPAEYTEEEWADINLDGFDSGDNDPKGILAAYLADPSFCKALWGEKSTGAMACATDGKPPKEIFKWMLNCFMAFEKLRDVGLEESIKYIMSTRIDDPL